MGKFIISRTAAGDRFILQTDRGYTLAVSRRYATLDACKKGIVSLIANAPTVPVRDLLSGERGPNPKFEILGREGAYSFVLKSANGKAVVTSGDFATKKACLRAISMLRTGVLEAEVLFERKGGLVPLQIGSLAAQKSIGDAERLLKKEPIAAKKTADGAQEASEFVPVDASGVEDIFSEVDLPSEPSLPIGDPPADPTPHPSSVSSPAAAPVTPRLVRIKPAPTEQKTASSITKTPHKSSPSRKKRSLLDILLKK